MAFFRRPGGPRGFNEHTGYQAPTGGDWWDQNRPPPQTNPTGWNPNDPRYRNPKVDTTGGFGTTPYTFTGTPTLQDLERYFTSRGVPPNEAPYWLSKWSELLARGQQLGNPNYAMERLSQAEAFGGRWGGQGQAGGGGAPGGAGVPGGAEWGAAGYGSFTAPPPAFMAPTDVTMANDPGYQFRLQEGRKALQGAAAAKGSILGGGTLKALDRYNQEYASGEFGNVYNRALGAYETNVGVQRGARQDYWSRLRDLYGGGVDATRQTYQRPPGY